MGCKKTNILTLTFVFCAAFLLSSCGKGTVDKARAVESAQSIGSGKVSEAPGAASTKVVTLRLSDVFAEGFPTSLANREFARLVEEKTQGRVKVEVFNGGTLYNDEALAVEALRRGDVALARISAGFVAPYVPKINAIQMPYLYTSAEHMWKVLNGPIGQEMLSDLEASQSGLVGLCYYDAGARSFYLTREVKEVKDMAGLKIRVQDNPMAVRMCELLGAKGVTGIGSAIISTAIQTEAIDGAENNYLTYVSMGDYKVAKYYIEDAHMRIPALLVGSKAILDKLSPDDLELIKEAARSTEEFEIKEWKKQDDEAKDIILKSGNSIIELTDEAYKEFQDKMQPLYTEFASKYMDTIQAIRDTN